jgi:hypothetical protein
MRNAGIYNGPGAVITEESEEVSEETSEKED